MKAKTYKLYGVIDREGDLVEWVGLLPFAEDCKKQAGTGVPFDVFQRMINSWKERWNWLVKNYGWKVVKFEAKESSR